jgi:FtsP/CotA-like multicopper oxidase with cupredoxin domain
VATGLDDVRPGQNLYGFDPTSGPGYAWHCHILDHEDNQMMRPYLPTS